LVFGVVIVTDGEAESAAPAPSAAASAARTSSTVLRLISPPSTLGAENKTRANSQLTQKPNLANSMRNLTD
jgi:hypothetical protein